MNLRHRTLRGYYAAHWLWCALLLAGVCSLGSAQAQHARFNGGWEGQWQYAAAGGVCSLGLDLIEYGHARFAVAGDGEMTFELQALRDAQFGEGADAHSLAPGWHPAAGQRRDLGPIKHIPGGGLTARGAQAQSVLSQLQLGFLIELSSPTWFDSDQAVTLQLSPQGLRPALGEFLECAKSDISVSWAQMSRMRLGYAVDEHVLDPNAEQRLTALAQYVAADPSITSVYVDGHTDASGNTRHNHGLAQRRASTVTKFLTDRGVAADKIVTRYHGASYPVADNATAAGKAQNRRTTVRLDRADPHSVASQ